MVIPVAAALSSASKNVTSALVKLASTLRTQVERKHLRSLQKTIEDTVAISLTAHLENLTTTEEPGIGSFLSSQYFSDACYQVLLVKAANLPATFPDSTPNVVAGYLHLFVDERLVTDWSHVISNTINETTTRILETDTFKKVLSSAHIEPSAHNLLIEQLLGSIAYRLDVIAGVKTPSRLADIDTFEKKYRSQIQTRFRNVVPPYFGTPKSVAFSKVYVAPTLLRDAQSVTLGDFTTTLHRTVVVGDPGGGKTTLATKIILDASSSSGLFGRKDSLTPFVVTLREYAARKQVVPLTVLEFINETLKTKFQIDDAPSDAVGFLLATGRAIVIFDGLDELLDTTLRVDAVKDVELFCGLHSTTPVLVTSRAVGYNEAPLDRDLFEVFTLSKFEPDEVKSYANKWFAFAPEIAQDERSQLATSFLQESEAVMDLTSNPLMLSLMCNLYRGERFIPRNRPELYEKCATFLFERWDKDRKILVPLPTDAHVRPAMMSIAYQVFEDPELQEGIARSKLETMATEYLLGTKFDSRDKAETAAEMFIDFCTGRAWVFSDTGSTETESLYQFTHRTFLEYFSASHLSRVYREPGQLLEKLLPHIRLAEWDVVSQLAIQIKAKQFEGASDELLEGLLNDAKSLSDKQKASVLTFTARCLSFLMPRESTVREVIDRLLQVSFEVDDSADSATRRPRPVGSRGRYFLSAISMISALSGIAEENEDAALEAFGKSVGEAIEQRNRVSIDLIVDRDALATPRVLASSDDNQRWQSRLEAEIMSPQRDALFRSRSSAAFESRFGCIFAFEAERMTASEFVRQVGTSEAFVSMTSAAQLTKIAPEAYRFLVQRWRTNSSTWESWAEPFLYELASSDPPWFKFPDVPDAFDREWSRPIHFEHPHDPAGEIRSLCEGLLLTAVMESNMSGLVDQEEIRKESGAKSPRSGGEMIMMHPDGRRGQPRGAQAYRVATRSRHAAQIRRMIETINLRDPELRSIHAVVEAAFENASSSLATWRSSHPE